jgi:hypothetical protein
MVAFRIVWTHLKWLKLIAFHLEVVIDIVACSAAQLSLKTSLLYIFCYAFTRITILISLHMILSFREVFFIIPSFFLSKSRMWKFSCDLHGMSEWDGMSFVRFWISLCFDMSRYVNGTSFKMNANKLLCYLHVAGILKNSSTFIASYSKLMVCFKTNKLDKLT